MDRRITRMAEMMAFGADLSEVHDHFIKECGSEESFYLTYRAALLLVGPIAESCKFAILAGL